MEKFKSMDFPNPSMVFVNGIELEVFEAGVENNGKPVVLCHGFPNMHFPGVIKSRHY